MRIKNSILACLAVVSLTACAGPVTFDQHLRQLEGKPVNDADLMLGHHATGQYQQGNRTVYVWQSRDVESLFGPSVTFGRGYQLGHAMDSGQAFIWSGIQLHSCVIRAATQDGIVQDVTYEGNPGGCERIYGRRRQELGYDASQRP